MDTAKSTDLTALLEGTTSYTVFAPTDDAIRALPEKQLEVLLKGEDKEALAAFVKRHIVKSAYPSKSIQGIRSVTSEAGSRLSLTARDSKLYVDASSVITADKEAANGVVHIVDRVIPSYERDLASTLDAEGFNTFALLVAKSDFKDVLTKTKQVTCFVPTEEGFERLPAGTLARLLSDAGGAERAAFVKRHLYFGRTFTSGMAQDDVLPMLDGQELAVTRSDKVVSIGDAKVLKPDIGAANGVVHGIDQCLWTPEK